MKKIIKGKSYDTDTATSVGEWESGSEPGDLSYVCETLYRKRSGEYFLHGEGGAASRYAEARGDSRWSGGERIMPMSYDAAKAWSEGHLDTEEYEAEFGEVAEDGEESVVLSVRVSPAAKAALDRLAAQTGRSKGEIVTDALLALR